MSGNHYYPDEAPVMNTLLDTLSHPIRREVISYFERAPEREAVAYADLVCRLETRMSSETDERLRVKLRHTHLPTLADRGWVEYDLDTGRIRYHGHDRAKQLLSEVHAIF